MSSINKFKLTPLNSAIRGFGVALLLSSQQAYSQTVAPPVRRSKSSQWRAGHVMNRLWGRGQSPSAQSQYTNLINGLNEPGVDGSGSTERGRRSKMR